MSARANALRLQVEMAPAGRVASPFVGGIPSPVLHELTGMLVRSVDGTAYQIRFLLSNQGFARQLGENGYQHVRENLLIT